MSRVHLPPTPPPLFPRQTWGAEETSETSSKVMLVHAVLQTLYQQKSHRIPHLSTNLEFLEAEIAQKHKDLYLGNQENVATAVSHLRRLDTGKCAGERGPAYWQTGTRRWLYALFTLINI